MNPFAKAGLVVLALLMAFFAFGGEGLLPGGLLLLWPLVVLLRLEFVLAGTIVLWHSGIRVPGVFSSFGLNDLFAVTLFGMHLYRVVMHRQTGSAVCRIGQFCTLGFGAVLLLTVAIRGTGFRVLGGDEWGGGRYVDLATGMWFALCAGYHPLRTATLKRTLLACLLLSTLPALCQFLCLVGGYPFRILALFVDFSGWNYDVGGDLGEVRLASGGVASECLMLIPLVMTCGRGASPVGFVVSWGAAFLIGAWSGHRLTIFSNLLLVLGCALSVRRSRVLGTLAVGALVVLLLLPVMATLAPHLPANAQRALSWVPTVVVDEEVAIDARGTLDWRLDVWKRAIREELPRYWLIGRGYTFDGATLYSLSVSGEYHRDWAFVQGAYHNGPLSLAIGMGVLGLLFGVGFLVRSARGHHRQFRREWADPARRDLHRAVYLWFCVHVVVFLLLYGDVYVSFPTLFFLFGVLQNLAAGAGSDEAATEL